MRIVPLPRAGLHAARAPARPHRRPVAGPGARRRGAGALRRGHHARRTPTAAGSSPSPAARSRRVPPASSARGRSSSCSASSPRPSSAGSWRWLDRRGRRGVLRAVRRRGHPDRVATLVVVAQSAGITFVGDVSPSLVVASGIVLLLSGLSVVGAAEDALEGYYVTAGARAFEVDRALARHRRRHLRRALARQAARLPDRDHARRPCSATTSSCRSSAPSSSPSSFAVMSYAERPRGRRGRGVAGGLGWVVLALAERPLQLGAVTASATAALVIGFAARLVARRLTISALAVTTAAIVPLLPGRMAYEGISRSSRTPTATGSRSACRRCCWPSASASGSPRASRSARTSPGLLVAKSQGVRPRPAAGATLPADPDPDATGSTAPRALRDERPAASSAERRPSARSDVSKHTAYDHGRMPPARAGW